MSDDPPSFHAANCSIDGCDWGTLDTSMPALVENLRQHMIDTHDYTEDEWREAAEELMERL